MTDEKGLGQEWEAEWNRLCDCVAEGKQQEFQSLLTRLLEQTERKAFRNGYEYAIELLQESIVKVHHE